MEFISSNSTSWCGGLLETNIDYVILPNSGEFFPNAGDSSPTPASPSLAIIPPWPKVSTPSRSSRHFLSVLPFYLQFRGHPH
jgi:hypothetical protein